MITLRVNISPVREAWEQPNWFP